MAKNSVSEINLYIMAIWFLRKVLRQFNRGIIVFTTNDTGTIGYPHSKDEFRPLFNYITNIK